MPPSGLKSRSKGVRGELIFSAFLRGWQRDGSIVEARRSAMQARGGHEAEDLIHSLGGFHLEVSVDIRMDVGTTRLSTKLIQAEADAKEGRVALVAWHPTRKPWRISWRGWRGMIVTSSAEGWMTAQGYTRVSP